MALTAGSDVTAAIGIEELESAVRRLLASHAELRARAEEAEARCRARLARPRRTLFVAARNACASLRTELSGREMSAWKRVRDPTAPGMARFMRRTAETVRFTTTPVAGVRRS